MRILFKDSHKSSVTGVTGVTVSTKPSNDGLLIQAEGVTQQVFDGVTGVAAEMTIPPKIQSSVTPVTQLNFYGVTPEKILKPNNDGGSSEALHLLHALHRKNHDPEKDGAQLFAELMKQASNVLRCRVADLPLHHFEQWEIDSINAGTFWCGVSEHNQILDWAAFNFRAWLNYT